MRILTIFFFILILLLGISFACLNANVVEINYYIGTGHFPLSLLLVIVLVVGACVGFLVGICLYWRVRCQNRRLLKRVKLAEKEIENIRSIPLKEINW